MKRVSTISIIIPAFNRVHLLKATLKSVQLQDITSWECIVIDDDSTEDIKTCVEDFSIDDSRFIYKKRPAHLKKGANACRNFGYSIAKGTYICWLDSDDILAPNHVKTHLDIHMQNSIDVSITNAVSFQNTTDNILQSWATIIPKENALKDMVLGNISWQTASAVWKNNSLPQRPFNENLYSSQEWTFHIQMLLQSIAYKIVPVDTVYIRRHQNRIGNDKSAKKFWSHFLSRYIIYTTLQEKHVLSQDIELSLLRQMHKALRKAIHYKYTSVYYKQLKMMLTLLPKSRYKRILLKTLFYSAPVYIVFGKGEKLFKIKDSIE